MANTSIDLVGLDFNSLKDNLKTFLKNNTQFKDLDYEGSNMSVLLDLLAYNTYLNGFYTNMVASEMFLDTAQLRDSIVSHAKELNYTPRSFTSAKSTITVDITPTSNVTSIAIPKYTTFTSRVGSNTYTFSTNEAYVVTASNTGAYSLTTDVYEGQVITETFTLNASNTAQRYVLSNKTIDTSSVIMTVYEDSGTTTLSYSKATTLVGVKNTSTVFFIQAAENQQYEVLFGDNTFGRRPKDGAIAVVKYRAASGELPNGAATFAVDGPIDGHTDIEVATVSVAAGGAVAESNESIRFNAPRSFQAQDRAVTTSDYETLLKNNFSDIQAISVFGGEEHDPPQYGRVYISVDVADADGAPESRKSAYLDFIKARSPLTIDVEFINPDFAYLQINTTVNYNVNVTTKTTADIKTAVQAAISSYNTTNLADFKTTMYYSALCKAIDAADGSIIGNDTVVTLVKRINPALDTDQSITVSTLNELATETGLKLASTEAHYGHTLTSSTFIYQGSVCVLVDDTLGNVYIAAQQGTTIQVLKKVGTLNYTTGKLQLTTFRISSYAGSAIELKFKTLSKNISSSKNVILQIDVADVTVNVNGVKQ